MAKPAMPNHAYTVVVTRENGTRLADVPELQGAHTYARTLPELDQYVREVIGLAADLPEEAVPDLRVDYEHRESGLVIN
ncbi:type II toxin-antitoxin system HicB family antitoxin [Streptoalloteichus hindustanus]|uniref:Uncharacterized protein n=1 Tax=Streptoalloteichus hindustanus TaxID=2017 RepID=A0A1M5GMA6_STRHI|nr:hypothetical protein [Streptoalloteichus hindustanus]SHG04798.1 hypothetical protein SAMN05444320_106177 [Streptoalloteichus hindustanus]